MYRMYVQYSMYMNIYMYLCMHACMHIRCYVLSMHLIRDLRIMHACMCMYICMYVCSWISSRRFNHMARRCTTGSLKKNERRSCAILAQVHYSTYIHTYIHYIHTYSEHLLRDRSRSLWRDVHGQHHGHCHRGPGYELALLLLHTRRRSS